MGRTIVAEGAAAAGLVSSDSRAGAEVKSGPASSPCAWRPSRPCWSAGDRDRARAPSGTSSVTVVPGAHVGPVADGHGRDELRVASDEGPLADRRAVLLLAVVVAGDDARADVRAGADLGVAEVGEVERLDAPAARRVFLVSTKLPIAGVLLDLGAGPDAGERADPRPRPDRRASRARSAARRPLPAATRVSTIRVKDRISRPPRAPSRPRATRTGAARRPGRAPDPRADAHGRGVEHRRRPRRARARRRGAAPSPRRPRGPGAC